MLAYSRSKYKIYQVIRTSRIWLGTKRKSAHINSTQMVLSMCSSRYCSTFATHFFLYFRAIIVFLGFFDFFFLFFWYFSSLRCIKEVTTENIRLNKWKAWPMENSEDVLKIDKKLMTTKRGSCDQFLAKIKFSESGCFTFAPLFFVYFWSINIFLGFFEFFLLFLWHFFFT